MKNLMVANIRSGARHDQEHLETMLKAQIENSLEVGWKPEDIIIVSNFKFQHSGIKSHETKLNKHCLTGSKMFAVQWALEQNFDEVYWAHDLDCWQHVWFDTPEFKDVGICEYSTPRYNGGSVFWRNTAKDIVDHVANIIVETKAPKEEPVLNDVLKRKYGNRVTVLNSTYNIGCSGFVKRYERAIKPIRVSHFHPTNRIAWETHALDRNQLGHKSISSRLERLVRRFWPYIATQLQENDPKNVGKKLIPGPSPFDPDPADPSQLSLQQTSSQ